MRIRTLFSYGSSAVYLLCCAASLASAQDRSGLHNAPTHEGWSFINAHGQIANERRYATAGPFVDGFAVVSSGGKYGYVNASGDLSILLRFQDAQPFSDGIASVRLGDKWGFIDQTGKIVIQPVLERPASFSEGFAAVFPVSLRDPMAGGNFLNKAGKFILQAGHGAVLEYSEHAAWVSNFERGQAYWVVVDLKQQAISGKVTSCLLPKKFSGGLSALQRTCEAKWGFVDRTGRQSIPPIYDNVRSFSDGLAAVKVADKWGYIATDGSIRIAPMFDAALDFVSGLAPAVSGGKLGYIGINGKWVIPPEFTVVYDGETAMAGNFEGGLAVLIVSLGNGSDDYGMEYIDIKGHIVYGPSRIPSR